MLLRGRKRLLCHSRSFVPFGSVELSVPPVPPLAPLLPCEQLLHRGPMSQTLLQILVLGPEASGKSTMTRHLLCKGGDSWKRLEKPQRETGRSPPTHARVLDRPRAEQRQGAAPSHLLQHFKTPKYEVIVVDSLEPGGLPGNPFPGSAPAGAAVLLVPAAGGQREAGCAVTCQQVLLACNLPAKQLVVCVNKMDATQPPYSCQRYQEITQAVCAFLRQLGKNPATVAFLPISGLHGDNLLEPSSRRPLNPRGGQVRNARLEGARYYATETYHSAFSFPPSGFGLAGCSTCSLLGSPPCCPALNTVEP
ncbi:hypothetical protein KIL84_013400 [Mauremys mutica]|uniref:Tr-type G domain-containing protein n=1 Tax=Mauremys mutica TaxID=74926 RepID=A0A9D4AUA8_9SAUR|nr:hypothetical protein KIL84_013400 [Mauremys mutica]